MTTLQTVGLIIAIVLLFNFMIFFHELGHFFAARWRGLYVDRFQIWFGKALWKKKINGVEWGIGWIPAGGFVSLPQMAPMEAIEGQANLPEDLKPISALDKVIVAAAGPFASFVLAVVFALLVWGIGKPDIEFPVTTIGYVPAESSAAKAGLQAGDRILQIDGTPVDHWTGGLNGVRELIKLGEAERIQFLIERPGVDAPMLIESGYEVPETAWWQRGSLRSVGILPATSAVVGGVLEGSPAAKAGIQPGDEVVTLDGEKVWSPAAVGFKTKSGAAVTLGVKREGVEGVQSVTVTPEVPKNWQGMEKSFALTGIMWAPSKEIRQTTIYPTPTTQVVGSLKWIGDTFKKLFAPKSEVGVQHLSGPVGIATSFYQMLKAEDGWKLALWFAVVLNINLAVLNILPLPVVDGGHVVLGFLEMIVGRPVGGKVLEMVQIGFVLVLFSFFLFVTFKDVGDLFGKPSSSEEKLPPPTFLASSMQLESPRS
jgi:regulator of sigma E protease